MKKVSYIILSALFFVACSANQDKESNNEQQQNTETITQEDVKLSSVQLKNAELQIEKAVIRPIYQSIHVNGFITVPPSNKHTISFAMGGHVRTNNMRSGMFVKQGTLLATLEDMQYIQLQEDYLINKSKLDFAQADFIRQETLNKTKSSSDKVFQQAQAEFKSQQVLTHAIGQKLQLIGINPQKLTASNISKNVKIYAPVSGYITAINANPGKYISPTDVLFELISPKDMYISLTFFEKDAQNLEPGQKVIWYGNNNASKSFESTIKLINRNIDQNRTVEVQCLIMENQDDLLPGTFVNAEIQQEIKESLSLPDEAIVRWQNEFYVFIAMDNHHFKMQKIEKGISAAGFTQILSPIADHNIVTKNAYVLLMMLKNNAEE